MREEKKYSLIIKTDKYAGNFERALTAWLFGVGAGTHWSEDKMREIFKSEVEASVADLLIDAVELRPYEEYGLCPCRMTGAPDYRDVEVFLYSDVVEALLGDVIYHVKSRLGSHVRVEVDSAYFGMRPVIDCNILGLEIKTVTEVTEYSEI